MGAPVEGGRLDKSGAIRLSLVGTGAFEVHEAQAISILTAVSVLLSLSMFLPVTVTVRPVSSEERSLFSLKKELGGMIVGKFEPELFFGNASIRF